MAHAAALPLITAESGLTRYLEEIRRFPMLEPQEEFMLANRWREQGDREAAHRLVPRESRDTVLRVGPLELDLIERTAKRGDRTIDLLPREFRLLKYMMSRKEQMLTRAMLLEEVWDYKFVPQTNLVDVHMGRLRRKEDEPNEPPMIHNVRGVGFILRAPA